MDYEKAYKEALAKAREIHRNEDEKRSDMEWLFPELKESEDERIRKELVEFVDINTLSIDERHDRWIAWLEKQGNCSAKWHKNSADNKPAINHSVLMMNIHGIAEGEWNGKEWIQYRWSSNIKDSDVLAWMELSDLEKQGEQKPVDKVEPFDKYEGLTDFERTLADICIGWIGEELGWKQYIKDNADVLLKIAIKMFNSIQDAPFEQKPAWSDEDENMANDLIEGFLSSEKIHHLAHSSKEIADWLKSLKDRVKGKEEKK